MEVGFILYNPFSKSLRNHTKFFLFFFLINLFYLYPSSLLSQDNEDETSGDGFKITGIEIILPANSFFQSKDILSIIQTGRTSKFSIQEFDLDLRRIDKFYFDNGFFDAEIDTSLLINVKEKEVEIIFKITENNPYNIDLIEYKGLDFIPRDISSKVFDDGGKNLRHGNRYSKKSLNDEIIRIVDVLNNNGYAFAIADEPEVLKILKNNLNSPNLVKIILNFSTGNFYYYGKTDIEIKNNKYGLNIYEIKYALDYKEGDIFSKKSLLESENNLTKLNILENARIVYESVDSVLKRINLKVIASVRNKFELEPEIVAYDISNRFYAGAGITFTDRYFLGGARTLTTKAQLLYSSKDYNIAEISAQMDQPFLFNYQKLLGTWKLTYSLVSQSIFNISVLNNSIKLDLELPKFTYLNNTSLEWKLANERFSFGGTIQDPETNREVVLPNITIDLFTSTLAWTLIHNNSNSFSFPSRGNFQSFLLEESGLIGKTIQKIFNVSTFSYLKFSHINKFYFNITESGQSSVLASKFLIGVLFETASNKLKIIETGQEVDINVIPIDSRFIAGGSTSVRGWQAKKLGTFPERENGGNFLIEGNIEHRIKPFFDTKGLLKDFGFVTFFDYGNLWKEIGDFSPYQINLAIGFGIRYYTLVGPFRFDIGFRLYDFEAEQNGTKHWLFQNDLKTVFSNKIAFQFGIGNTF